MSDDKLLTVREVAIMLGVSEKDVVDLAEKGTLPAYKVGGVYLRFKKEQVDEFKKSNKDIGLKVQAVPKGTMIEKIRDFLYFYDFYIFIIACSILLLVVIFRG